MLCHCRAWNMTPTASRDARKHLGRWGKKLQCRESPPPTAASMGLISDTLLRTGNALPSCHPNIPELPLQAVCSWFHCGFHCQSSSTGAYFLLPGICVPHAWCQIHTQGKGHWGRSWENDRTSSGRLQLFALLIETQFKYCPGAACHCPTLGFKSQKSWKTAGDK